MVGNGVIDLYCGRCGRVCRCTIYGMVYIDFRAILALTESLNTKEHNRSLLGTLW